MMKEIQRYQGPKNEEIQSSDGKGLNLNRYMRGISQIISINTRVRFAVYTSHGP